MLKQTDKVLTEGLKDAKRATKNLAKDLAATTAELKAELQEISVRCSVLDSELRTVSVAQAGPAQPAAQAQWPGVKSCCAVAAAAPAGSVAQRPAAAQPAHGFGARQ